MTPVAKNRSRFTGRKDVQSVDRNHERNFQFLPKNCGCMAAWKDRMSVNHVKRLTGMRRQNSVADASCKESAGCRQAWLSRKRKITQPPRCHTGLQNPRTRPIERLNRDHFVRNIKPGSTGQRFRYKAALRCITNRRIKRSQCQDAQSARMSDWPARAGLVSCDPAHDTHL